MADLIGTARVQSTDLADIMDHDMTTGQVNRFINAASRLVDGNLADSGLSSGILTDIELWLTAHLATVLTPQTKSENIAGEWSFTVQGQTGLGLDATYYGQQVKLLDTTGTLDKLGQEQKKARITVLKDLS